MRSPTWLVAVVVLALGCEVNEEGRDSGIAADLDAITDLGMDAAGTSFGAVGIYEAESGALAGGAVIVGTADGRVRSIGDLAGEASGREAVTLTQPGDAVAFTLQAAHAGTNSITIRFSLPDAPAGGGFDEPLALTVTVPNHAPIARSFTLTSRYAWLYGGSAAGTKLYNVPAKAAANAGSDAPTHLYDEAQLMLGERLPAGSTLTFALPPEATQPVTLDFVEVEVVAPPLTAPPGFLSIVDPPCGALTLDTHGTGQAFDGIDDAAYASVFNAAAGINPFNPTSASGLQSAGTEEKDYYSTSPTDALSDTVATSASADLGMFALADHNYDSLVTCIAQATAAGSGYAGVWIPPGRFYVRGTLQLPSNLVLRGAGMWYAKLVAVDTAPPMPVTNVANGNSGIASTSGNLRLVPASGTVANVSLSDFAMFGNSTQRDVVDRQTPVGVVGAFTESDFSRLWIEHYSQGIVMNGSAANDLLDALRVRNTFADGIDLYGSASTSTITHSQSRGGGDDGIAIWSQGTTTPSTGNVLAQSEASLEWFGNGLAVYGGENVTLIADTASDVLAGAGLKLATEFVPASLPAMYTMTGVTGSNVSLRRCGGTSFGVANGALLIGAEIEAISGMSLDHLEIVSPTSVAFDLRVLSNIGTLASPGALTGLAISDARVIGASACGSIDSDVHGDSTWTNVCACASTSTVAAPCAVDNQAGSAFLLPSVTCTEAGCAPP